MDTDFCYFCMQLPEISIGETPAISLEDFDDRLNAVAPKAARYVLACTFPPPPEVRFPRRSAAAKFRTFEESLRYEIARFRAAKSGVSIPPRPRGLPAVKGLYPRIEALAGFNPLEREKKLDEIRNAFLEELATANPLTREAAACYRIRLSLIRREATFGDPAGREVFRNTVDEIEQESFGRPDHSAGTVPDQQNPTKAEV